MLSRDGCVWIQNRSIDDDLLMSNSECAPTRNSTPRGPYAFAHALGRAHKDVDRRGVRDGIPGGKSRLQFGGSAGVQHNSATVKGEGSRHFASDLLDRHTSSHREHTFVSG